jgi:hypothetical protein
MVGCTADHAVTQQLSLIFCLTQGVQSKTIQLHEIAGSILAGIETDGVTSDKAGDQTLYR